MKSVVIIAIAVVAMIGMMVPNAYATTGEIILDQREFTIHRGNIVQFPVIVEVSDYYYHPSLEIIHNGEVIQKIALRSNGDFFHNVIGLNENWSSGNYIINLKYQGMSLDSESFVILRDNEVESKVVIYKNMHNYVEPFISLDVNKLILENTSQEIIEFTGHFSELKFGHSASLIVEKPDGTTDVTFTKIGSSGDFVGFIQIDKHWTSGEYSVSATLLDNKVGPIPFEIQNNWETPIFTESQLIGSFEMSSSTSHDYTILDVTGIIETDESEITLSIGTEDMVMYEDVISLDAGSFETSMVLYDYTTNTPWEYGTYSIHGMIGEKLFHSKSFTIDEHSFIVPQIHNMNLFMEMQGDMQKMVDTTKVEINAGDVQQVILSGTLDDYVSGDTVTVHLIAPNGVDSESHLIASEDGDYYMPIMIDDLWVSGQYTAYVTYGDFMDESSSFSVINHAITSEEIIIENEIVINDDPVELKNYFISLNDHVSSSSVHYTAMIDSYYGKTPINISLNGKIIDQVFTYSGNDGFLDYYLLLDSTWSSGNYTVSYVENNIAVPLGEFEILNNTEITVDTIDTSETSDSKMIHTTLSLDNTIFKTSTYFVDTVSFFGSSDYSGDVTVFLDGIVVNHVRTNSDGEFGGIIFLSDKLGTGFHNVSVQYGDVTESAEFLITTNNIVRLTDDITISKNEILEAGGAVIISVSGIMPNFIPSEIQPLLIEVTGVASQEFSVMPKMYGYYLQNFALDDTLGEYDVTVSYGRNILENHSISVVPAESSWVKKHAESWLNGSINDESFLKKAVLMIDEHYEVYPGVITPEWFGESAAMWVDGSMSDDSFYDAVSFLADGLLQ